jgi:hypothetical protein
VDGVTIFSKSVLKSINGFIARLQKQREKDEEAGHHWQVCIIGIYWMLKEACVLLPSRHACLAGSNHAVTSNQR